MLHLQRKPGKSLVIGDDIEVTVLRVQGGQIRLGFECPPEVPIRRSELATRADGRRKNGEAQTMHRQAG